MKKIKYIISSILVAGLLVGCDVETPSQDSSDIGTVERYPTPTFTFNGGELSANESLGTVYTWTVTLDKATDRAVEFNFEDAGGSATMGEDFIVTKASIAAYDTTGTLTLTVLADTTPEETETIKLTANSGTGLGTKYLVNPNTDYPSFEASIENYTSDQITATFNWETDMMYDGDAYSACTYVDMDVYITTTSEWGWANEIGNYDGATGDCPEDIDINALGDGTFYFWTDLWDVQYASLWAPGFMPITTTISQTGVVSYTFVQDESDSYTKEGGNTQGGNSLLMKVVVSGDTWEATQN